MTTKVRVCKKCNKQNLIEAWSCSSCGATLSVDTITEASSIVQEKDEIEVGKELTDLEASDIQEPTFDEGLPIEKAGSEKDIPEEEKLLLEEKGIIITNQRAIFGLKSYEIKNIKSVTKITVVQGKTYSYAAIISGILALFCFLFVVLSGRELEGPPWEPLLLLLTFFTFMPLAFVNVDYIVQISDNNGIHNAYQSQDLAATNKIVKAINEAIDKRES